MSDDKSGGPAFPFQYENGRGPETHTGMTMRQWYAGKFLQGYMASTSTMKSAPDADRVAQHAFVFADAMIKAEKA